MPMKSRGAILKLLLAVAIFATACVAAPFLRIGSGPLNASVENERDAAIDRAVAWLVASQSPEGHWGGSNVVATAVAALAIRGDREEMPKADAEAVERAVKWLKSPDCTNAIATVDRAMVWRRIAIVVLDSSGNNTTNSNTQPRIISRVVSHEVFDNGLSSLLAQSLLFTLTGCRAIPFHYRSEEPALAFIMNTFVKTPPPAELKPLVENLACAWNEATPAVWLSNPEAGWWLARAINGATGGDLSLPPDADGRVRNVNWRGIMAGKWINSQRIDCEGNGHWDGDAEKTAFAVLLLNEM